MVVSQPQCIPELDRKSIPSFGSGDRTQQGSLRLQDRYVMCEWELRTDKRGGGRTNDRFPDAKSIIRRGMERWKDLIGAKWGSRYSVLQYRAWKSSIAKRTGVLSLFKKSVKCSSFYFLKETRTRSAFRAPSSLCPE